MQHRITGRRLATVAVSTTLTLTAFGGSAWAAPSTTATDRHQPASDSSLLSVQPASTADFSGNGANVHGPYDSTRDGSASLNGKGDGQATGKPCAGCVGKADNKNPKGQLPGGSDNNAGYECDRNQGIGQSNPAHTGCTTPTSGTPTPVITPVVSPVVSPVVTPVVTVVTPVVTPVTTPVTTPVDTEPVITPATSGTPIVTKPVTAPSTQQPADVLGESAGQGGATAPGAAVSDTSAPGTQVLGEHVTRATSTAVAPAAAAVASLPFTGANHTGGMVLTALLLIAAGIGLIGGTRRRTA